MSRRNVSTIADEIAAALVLAEVADLASIHSLIGMFRELAKSPASKADPDLMAMAKWAAIVLAGIVDGTAGDASAELESVTKAVSEFQRRVDRPGAARQRKSPGRARAAKKPAAESPAPPPGPSSPCASAGSPPQAPGLASGGTFDLPEGIDPEILHEFLSAQRGVLDEMESDILAIDRGDSQHRDALRRRVHTMKGEAGVLGLNDLSQVCHALEDFIESKGPSAENTDRLLSIHNWICRAVDAYASMRLPDPAADVAISGLIAAAPPTEAREGTAAQDEEDGLQRDPDTIEVIGEFLGEGEEGLSKVDQVLMNVERDGTNAETINTLFRVFHSMKGVAASLELREITSLAHTTETMLNGCRQGTLPLAGAVLDLVFDATGMMRRMLEAVRNAVAEGTPLRRTPNLDALLEKIQTATKGDHVVEKAPPPAKPGDTLGKILMHPSIGVPSEAIASAIETQKVSGRRLGEELVAEGLAEPWQVMQALRAQKRVTEGVRLRETIKVDLERLDGLVEMIGELVIVESLVINAPEVTRIASPLVRNSLGQLAKVTRDLQDVGMSMRMVPVSGVFQKMARIVRDLSQKSGKQVRLTLSGESTEMDRSMVEQIADPLVHIFRNAMDHGIEGADERRAAGKPAEGSIRLSAYHESGNIVIEVADDGRGLDRDAILRKARAQGLVKESDILSEADINALIFAPGFSTAKVVTEISGRGVGMDVVKRNIDALRGRVLISTAPGKGTTLKIVMPLTLAIIDGMLVTCGEERYIVPTLSIVESIKPDRSMLVVHAGRHELLNVRGQILPLLRLSRLFDLSGAEEDATRGLAVIVEGVGRRLALLVDNVLTQQQVVIKTLGSALREARFVSGAAILADGRVGLILNVEQITRLTDDREKEGARRTGSSGATGHRFSMPPETMACTEEART